MMRSKSVLLGSVSVVAITAAAAPAIAQDNTVPDGYSLSVEGGFLMGPNDLARDKLGYYGGYGSAGVVEIQDNVGYRAAISLGKRIDPLWDLRVGASLNHQLESVSTVEFTYSSGGSSGEVLLEMRNDFDFENLDFEAGYTPVLDGNFQVRLFAGIRGLHYTDSADKLGTTYSTSAGYSSGGTISLLTTSEFIGAGPRIGVEGSTRFGGNFGISGMLAGAVIHGLERTSGSVTISEFSGASAGFNATIPLPGSEEWKTILDLEASLGLDYFVAEQTKLTLGYRAEQLFNVGGNSFYYSSGGSPDRLVHGPFVKAESKF